MASLSSDELKFAHFNDHLRSLFCNGINGFMMVQIGSKWFCGSNFLQLGSTFYRIAQKRGQKLTGKNLNVDRQLFKDLIVIF